MRLVVVLLLACATQVAICQSINRCLPWFSDEKISFNLVGLDDANKDKKYFTNLFVGPQVDTAKNQMVPPGTIYFKVCSSITDIPSGCQSVPEATAYFVTLNGTCLPLNVIMSSIKSSPLKNSSTVTGVSVGYDNSALPSPYNAAMIYNVKYSITCDKAITNNFVWTSSWDNSGRYIVLSTSAAAGCNMGISDILDIFQNNKMITFAVFLAIGLLFCFFGRHSYKWTLLLCGFLLGFLVVAGMCYSMGMFVNATDQRKYMILGIAALVGLLAGFLLFYFEQTTVSLICGVLTALMVKALLSLFFPTLITNNYVEMAILMVAGIIGGAVGSYFKEYEFRITSARCL